MFEFMFGLFFFIVFCMIIASLAKGISQWHTNNNSPILNVHATVINKKVSTTSQMGADGVMFSNDTYHVTFKYDNGNTGEFVVGHKIYHQLSIGTSGTLLFQGTRFLSFE